MDVQTAFWEMVREVGSSHEEINELGAGVNFTAGAKVSIWITEMSEEKPMPEKLTHYKNFTVLFSFKEIDLYDPDSLEALNKFIIKARLQKESSNRARNAMDHGLTASDSIMAELENENFIKLGRCNGTNI